MNQGYYCGGCADEFDAERRTDQRARSTLTLLSRVAVFMWMEAMVCWIRDDGDGGTNYSVPAGPPDLMRPPRLEMFDMAIARGLLRVDWGRP